MKKPQWYIVISILSILIGSLACAPGIISGRISTATYYPYPANATFFVVPSDRLTLTEKNLQNLIAREMEKLGFMRSTESNKADLAVVYSYSIGAGSTSVSSSPDFVWGGQKVESSTKYPRYFSVGIIDRRKTINSKEPVFVWQGEIYSSGSSSNIAWLAESFIPELFKWYGKNVSDKVFITPRL
jgi:hypothetical protein